VLTWKAVALQENAKGASLAKELSIQIDGDAVDFTPGETVLEVAERLGKEIPTLCWDKRLDPMGSCRLCLVQVEGRRLPAASCTLRAESDMVVRTDTKNVKFLQGTLLQMVLSENPDDNCPRCRDIAPCELHALAERFHVKRDRFLGAISNQSKEDSNPFLLRDYDRCISCYRCVRICAEIEGDYAITMAGRGFDKRIATAFDQGLLGSPCTLCGQCIYTCPTGALADKKMVGVGVDKKPIEETKSVCPYCGTGCSIYLHTKEDKLIGVTPDLEGPVNQGALCVKGQFGFDFVNSEERLRTPLMREDGNLREASWDEALDYAASRLQATRDEHGSKAFYGIASGRAPGESAFLLQKFTRAVMGSNQIDNCSRA
jgi:formate dehydrogenase alpha subunit